MAVYTEAGGGTVDAGSYLGGGSSGSGVDWTKLFGSFGSLFGNISKYKSNQPSVSEFLSPESRAQLNAAIAMFGGQLDPSKSQYSKEAAARDANGVVKSIFDNYSKTDLPQIYQGAINSGSYNGTTNQLLANDAFASANTKASQAVLDNVFKYGSLRKDLEIQPFLSLLNTETQSRKPNAGNAQAANAGLLGGLGDIGSLLGNLGGGGGSGGSSDSGDGGGDSLNSGDYGKIAAQLIMAYLASGSDRKFKTDITRIGQTDDGIPLYKYRYKWEKKFRIGVMADELEAVKPEAVTEIDGYKYVDYGVL